MKLYYKYQCISGDGVCVCVCENIICGSLHGCNSKIHWVEKSKNIIPFSLSAAVEPGQNA